MSIKGPISKIQYLYNKCYAQNAVSQSKNQVLKKYTS